MVQYRCPMYRMAEMIRYWVFVGQGRGETKCASGTRKANKVVFRNLGAGAHPILQREGRKQGKTGIPFKCHDNDPALQHFPNPHNCWFDHLFLVLFSSLPPFLTFPAAAVPFLPAHNPPPNNPLQHPRNLNPLQTLPIRPSPPPQPTIPPTRKHLLRRPPRYQKSRYERCMSQTEPLNHPTLRVP